eukprot:1151251-Pelagomonas_calceolata.AAC.4
MSLHTLSMVQGLRSLSIDLALQPPHITQVCCKSSRQYGQEPRWSRPRSIPLHNSPSLLPECVAAFPVGLQKPATRINAAALHALILQIVQLTGLQALDLSASGISTRPIVPLPPHPPGIELQQGELEEKNRNRKDYADEKTDKKTSSAMQQGELEERQETGRTMQMKRLVMQSAMQCSKYEGKSTACMSTVSGAVPGPVTDLALQMTL